MPHTPVPAAEMHINCTKISIRYQSTIHLTESMVRKVSCRVITANQLEDL